MQNAADTSALEGLRQRDTAGEPARRANAKDMLDRAFVDPAGQRQMGAGPDIPMDAPADAFNANQKYQLGASPFFIPAVQYNQNNCVNGDMVAGGYTAGADHTEGGDYSRLDYAPVVNGDCTMPPDPALLAGAKAFLVRLRRTIDAGGTYDPSALDNQPNISSSGSTLPMLFGRANVLESIGAHNPRHDGFAVRATAIANAANALQAGPAGYGRPGLSQFAIDKACWISLFGGVKFTPNGAFGQLDGDVCGVASAHYIGTAQVIAIGDPPPNVVAAPMTPGVSYVPIMDSALGMVVGFGYATVATVPGAFTVTPIPNQIAMVPKEFRIVVVSASAYRVTQPLVALRFFRTLFIPDALSPDTDHLAVTSIWQGGAWAGFVFLPVVICAAIACSRRRPWRPAAFGLWWFLLAFLPAAMLPVSEVENDHRMFFPFAGLVLGVCWPIALWIYSRPAGRRWFVFGAAALCTSELVFCALATQQRNLVWRTEESLWYDAMLKSPRNGKNMMSYAASQIKKGNLQRALYSLNQATIYMPYHGYVEFDLGVLKGELGRHEEAERHFRRGIRLEPNEASGHDLYAAWLEKQGRWPETLDQLRVALDLNPDYMDTYYLLMRYYAKRDLWPATRKVANHVLGRFPSDPDSKAYLLMAAFETTGLAAADPFTKSLETPDNLLSLSALYFHAGKFERSVAAAAEAVKLRQDYPEAYNNMATAYRELGSWDLAIQASRQALRLKPDYGLARENLARSEEQKRKAIAQ